MKAIYEFFYAPLPKRNSSDPSELAQRKRINALIWDKWLYSTPILSAPIPLGMIRIYPYSGPLPME